MEIMRDRCINCGIKIRSPKQQVADLEESLQLKLGQYISPVILSPSHRLCLKCEESLLSDEEGPAPGARLAGHCDVCATCGTSLLRARAQPSNFNASDPNYELLMSWIPAELQGRLRRACRACCLRAKRALNKTLSQAPQLPGREAESAALERDEAENSPAPPDNSDSEQGKDAIGLTLPGYLRALYREEQCVYPWCAGAPLALAPLAHRQELLIRHNTYMPPAARLCRPHLDRPDSARLVAAATPTAFTGEQLADILFLMKNIKRIVFSDVERMDPLLRKHWLDVTGEEWREMVRSSSLQPLALCVYLVQRRWRECEEVLCSLFQLSRAEVEKALHMARAVLEPAGADARTEET